MWIFDFVSNLGYKNIRLYTDPIANSDAVSLYRKIGMFEEKYIVEKLPMETIIFSKSLSGEKITALGNFNLHLLKQLELQNK